VAFRPRLSAGLALSAKSEHTPGVVGYQGSPILDLRERGMSAFGCRQQESFERRSPKGAIWITDPRGHKS